MITDLTRERYARFAEHVEKKDRQGRWLVLTHDNPDPDALASAATLSRILHRGFRKKVTTAYGGIIGRAENREMVRSLNLRLSHIRHLNFKNYTYFALVDTQPRTGNNQLPDEVIPDLVFDHHPPRKATQQTGFAEIRPDYGATATLLAEYLLASGLEIPKVSATALVYAIRSETQDFGRESAGPDKQIYDLLLPKVDKRLLARIQNSRLPVSYFRNLHEALERLEGVDTLIISHLGQLEQPDIVPEIADLLLRMEGKTWSLCTGVYGDRLYLSLRTTNPRANAGRLMQRLIGRRGKGGGHSMMAGGWISAARSSSKEIQALQRQVAQKLAKALRKNPEKLTPLDLAKKTEG